VPASADVFDLVDASSIVGTPTFNFTAATLLPGLSWDTSDFATNGTIKVTGTVITDPFIGWASAHSVTGGKAGDDDNDGVSNLLEFATNADPQSGGSRARAYGKMHVLSGDNVLTYTVAVRQPATFAAAGNKQETTKDNVKYTVEGSNELGVWTAVAVTELNTTDSAAVQAAITPTLPVLEAEWEWHSFRTDGAAPADTTDFIRLKVEEAP
jgi:hypothetical protein